MVEFSGGGDEGGFNDGQWQDKDGKRLADFHVYTLPGKTPDAESPGENIPEGWSKTYDAKFETELKETLVARLYQDYSFDNEPYVDDGVLLIDAVKRKITTQGTESATESHPFKSEW